MLTNLERMILIDRAWNQRCWDKYGDLLSDDLVAHMNDGTAVQNKSAHIAAAKAFCADLPDNVVETDPYIELFASRDETKTCSVARMTGTMTKDLLLPDGSTLSATHRRFDLTFVAICRWQQGQIVEQREYFDAEFMLRQLRGEIVPPTR